MTDEPAVSLGSLLTGGCSQLRAAGIADPALDCRLLVAKATGLTPLDLVARPETPVRDDVAMKVREMLARRAAGEPVFRILGSREFYGLELALSAATLEPRSDTEILVDLVLPVVREIADREGTCRILDLGTGTGAIALALLKQVGQAHAVGADIAEGALATARQNARRHGLESRFETVQSDWYSNVTGLYHVIVANPPYIIRGIIETLDREVRNHDPVAALDGGPDGLDAYRQIARGARAFLSPGGHVAVETGHDQKAAVVMEFASHGFCEARSAMDLGGRDRALLFAG